LICFGIITTLPEKAAVDADVDAEGAIDSDVEGAVVAVAVATGAVVAVGVAAVELQPASISTSAIPAAARGKRWNIGRLLFES
jgi:hypothetical protein